MPGISYQTKPGLPSGCQVNIKCFSAKSICLCSNYRNTSSLTLVQKVIPVYLHICRGQWIIIAELACGLFPMIFRMVCPSCTQLKIVAFPHSQLMASFDCLHGPMWGNRVARLDDPSSLPSSSAVGKKLIREENPQKFCSVNTDAVQPKPMLCNPNLLKWQIVWKPIQGLKSFR
jgi:hypothetical protein